jgi:hypothetical protein
MSFKLNFIDFMIFNFDLNNFKVIINQKLPNYYLN